MKPGAITGYASLIIILFMASSALPLPVEKNPLRPRVPLKERNAFQLLPSPIYNESRLAEPAIIQAGQQVYERVCSNCHGESGDGEGSSGQLLPVKPRDFTNCLFQKKRTDGELFYVIKFGSWPMPPMIPLITEEEAWKTIAYLRTFCS